jgi:putative glutathione S-transferase
MFENGWSFKHDQESEHLYGTTGDNLYNSEYMFERYFENAPDYAGVISVPVLWDKQKKVIVNNESSEIIRMFNSAFNHITGNELDFYPEHLQAEIDQVNDLVYNSINNGVYKTGFATTQQAYEDSGIELFNALQKLDDKLATQRYLTGNELTEADWRLWPTLVRFDSVYHTHFKCNLHLIKEFKHLYNYMLELYQMPNIAQTVNMAHIKRHYYASHLSINTYGIVPLTHNQNWNVPHHREHVGA